MLVKVIVVEDRKEKLTISQSLDVLLALAGLLLGGGGDLLVIVVVVVRRSSLTLLATALLGSGGGRGRSTGLATSVFDLLQSGVGADSHALDGLGAELAGSLVVVDLARLLASDLERRERVYRRCHPGGG